LIGCLEFIVKSSLFCIDKHEMTVAQFYLGLVADCFGVDNVVGIKPGAVLFLWRFVRKKQTL
jgi:hypothetical protein